jgi:hypothetical protein
MSEISIKQMTRGVSKFEPERLIINVLLANCD